MIKLNTIVEFDEVLGPTATQKVRINPKLISDYYPSDLYPGCTDIFMASGNQFSAIITPEDLDRLVPVLHTWFEK